MLFRRARKALLVFLLAAAGGGIASLLLSPAPALIGATDGSREELRIYPKTLVAHVTGTFNP